MKRFVIKSMAAACAMMCVLLTMAERTEVPADATKYVNNVVCEVGTGTWCAWCVRGIAAMEYYTATYTGADGGGKVIPIGIHLNDPMDQIEYIYNCGFTSYPIMNVNRKNKGYDPKERSKVQSLVYVPTYWEARIDGVDLPENSSMAKVSFSVRAGYDASDSDMRYAVVVRENNVGPYEQNNAYSYPTSSVKAEIPSWLLPYLEPFFTEPSMYMMLYNNVARGIFPSYAGDFLGQSEWKKDEFSNFEFEFRMPKTISNYDNVSLVLLLLNPETGVITSAAEYYFGEDPSAVAEVAVEKPFSVVGDVIRFASEVKDVQLYGIDGTMVYAGVPRELTLRKGAVYIARIDGKPFRFIAR